MKHWKYHGRGRYYNKRHHHRGHRRRSMLSKAKRTFNKVYYSWPSRFSRKFVGRLASDAAMTGLRTAMHLGKLLR